jgi:hypothetical protein
VPVLLAVAGAVLTAVAVVSWIRTLSAADDLVHDGIPVTATVEGRRIGPAIKGAQYQEFTVSYVRNGRTRSAVLRQTTSTPVPEIGATVVIHVDPDDPTRAATEDGAVTGWANLLLPQGTGTAGALALTVAVVLGARWIPAWRRIRRLTLQPPPT